MAARQLTGYQCEVAERNVEAILDAAEELLRSQGHASISAVAAQAVGQAVPAGAGAGLEEGAGPQGGAGGFGEEPGAALCAVGVVASIIE